MTAHSIYAKPVAPRIIVRPALVSVLLHGLLLYALTANWSTTEQKVIEFKPAPIIVNARLVDASEFTPRKVVRKPARRAAAPAATVKRAPSSKKTVKTTVETKKPVAIPGAAKQSAKPVATAPAIEPGPTSRISEEELAAAARADLARAVAEEAVEQTAVTAAEMAASYAAMIQQTVVNYWSRPPSARNGMEAVLQVQMIPTGEIVSVRVLKSSGNSAFDRSAVNAVEKAGSFPELRNLPARDFEKTFRRFRLLFRPEDLRY